MLFGSSPVPMRVGRSVRFFFGLQSTPDWVPSFEIRKRPLPFCLFLGMRAEHANHTNASIDREAEFSVDLVRRSQRVGKTLLRP